ncbi:magnesium transporter [Alkalitalea saponilacus]|uniref:Magnesium transporter MgtE n=1 Tax=Alkalitalea saponilacus TaxID=889453 RepID=A0A1T5GVJ6_9BACT|nr:magnesium transporter [Alkalitalea saponilacus]ASB48177.1 magnesium transporter [Alkalitalea saponilacus]SKC12399.1 magnesium transporter [Alkalitalea saponilacus]
MQEIKDIIKWQDQLSSNELDREFLIPLLRKMPDAELGEIFQGLRNEDLLEVLSRFTNERQGLIFDELDMSRRLDFFQHVSKKRFAVIFENMPSDSRADMFQHLTQQEQAELIPYLTKKTREDVLNLSAYPPETAGGIMSTDFATITEELTCEEAINKVRSDAPSKKMVYHIYVVNHDMKLLGFVTLKDIILAEPHQKVSTIIHREFIYSHVNEDREKVAVKIEKYDLVAIPVINDQEQLLGIVLQEDAIEIIRAEHTEDLEKFMGIVPGKDILNYSQTTVWGHFKKRVVWLSSLAIIGLISGLIIHHYEEAMSALIILALYMPMVADTGGNTGSQAATVVIRAMALGQISLRNWLSVIFKETRISLLLAVVLGLIAFGKVLFLSWETEVPEMHSLFSLATGISLALSLQVITATIIGASLPMIVKKFGGDPAVAASPAITTVVDITGLLIYFGIATLFFFN